MVVNIFIYLEVFLSLVSYTIALYDNLATLLDGVHSPIAHLSTSNFYTITLIICLAMPSVWLVNLSKISFLSSVGVISLILLFVAVALTPAFSGIELNQKISSFNITKIPTVTGLYIFCFASHMVSVISFASVTLVYVTVGLLGARMFGAKVEGQITMSMPKSFAVTKMALIATTLTPLTKYAFEVFPIGVGVENSLPRALSKHTRRFIRRAFVSFFLLVVLVLALLAPQFQNVLALTGCIVSFGISVVIPCVLYLRIFVETSAASKTLLVAVICVSSVLGILGTITTGKSLVENM
ncbi:hypothetical protein MKW94_028555 [Papaver nudicaule]|uniref:Amino acid transporter transmembrane domain-containing protein n=1 Tax=Papaver nudicaule TaxID=74823 RepID=A0AA41SMB7_PAPNU|nr:hypothetical protein [Papaver nudicaule]